MGDTGMVIKDDGYNELDGIFTKDAAPIPGDELTGEISGDVDTGVKDDDDAGIDGGVADNSITDVDSSDNGVSDGASKEDLESGDVDTGEDDKRTAADTDDDGYAGKDEGEADQDGALDTSKEDSETDLRATLREQQRRVALTEAKLDTFSRQQVADKKADENETDIEPVEPSVLEGHQIQLNTLAETRGEIIGDMLELMKINPKFEDVESVCSKTNLEDTIETLARAQVAKEGGDLVETMMGMEVDVWSQRNPYSYMYGLIKDIHPRYKVAETDDKTGDKQDTSDGGKGKKAPAKAPLSALDLAKGGGGKDAGQWTAEKIDSLSETELNTVPKEVYAQYLRGDLDK